MHFWSLHFHFFHFGSYILFLPFFVPKPINGRHLSPYRQPTNGKNWGGRQNTLLADVAIKILFGIFI